MSINIQNRDLYSALTARLGEQGFAVSPYGARPSASPVPENTAILRQWLGLPPVPERALRFWRYDEAGQAIALAEIDNRQRDNLVRPDSRVTFFQLIDANDHPPMLFIENASMTVATLVGNEVMAAYQAPHAQNLPNRKPLTICP